MLADEPTAALDAHRGRQVMELFQGIAAQQGACVTVVTHDDRALDPFDRLLELDGGRLSEVAQVATTSRGDAYPSFRSQPTEERPSKDELSS